VPEPATEHLVLETAGRGLYRVSGRDLVRAGVAIDSIDPSRLQLFHLGHEIPILVRTDNAGGSLNEATTITFFAPDAPSAYRRCCGKNVLALTWSGDAAGQRMAVRPAWLGDDPVPVEELELFRHIEQDRLFMDSDPFLSAAWYWHKLSASPGAPDSRFLVIPDIHEPIGGGTATLRLALQGLTDSVAEVDHHAVVTLNGRWSRDLRWGGRSPHELSAELPSDLLVDGDNVVEVRLPGELEVFADQVLVDWLELRWPARGQRHGPVELSFRPPAEGLYELRVQGPRGNTIEVFDISDRDHPLMIAEPWLSREAVDLISFQHLITEPVQPPSFLLVDSRDVAAARVRARVGRHRDLLSGDNRADLLIVTDPLLEPAAQRLARHRSAQGLAVAVVTTAEIYSYFSSGFPVPELK
jgi:hypothetical protein